jgi:hypothetical protein
LARASWSKRRDEDVAVFGLDRPAVAGRPHAQRGHDGGVEVPDDQLGLLRSHRAINDSRAYCFTPAAELFVNMPITPTKP